MCMTISEQASGAELVGSRVYIRWTGERGRPWFPGRIAEWRPSDEAHLIVYDDGDEKLHYLSAEETAGQLRWITPPAVKAVGKYTAANETESCELSRLGHARSRASLEVTTISHVPAVTRVLERACKQAQAEFALRHPRGGTNDGRFVKIRLYDCSTSVRRQHERLSLNEREAVLAATLPPALVSRPSSRLVHMELIYYGKHCGGHVHMDPMEEGDEIVIATLQGGAWFKLYNGNAVIDETLTERGTLVRLAGPARNPCKHQVGPAEGGARVALQLGFSG